jgi:hypothetical protein
MIKRVASVVVLLAGCGGPQPQSQPTATAPPAAPAKAPFEYRIVSTDEKPHDMGPQVVVRLETTNEVAKAATEDDLQQLWRHLGPDLGDRRVFIKLDTGVPGASLWGHITRLNLGNGWEVKVGKSDTGIDAEPYYFVDKIDRTKSNQGAMILTLPLVNKIIERLKLAGWTQTYRSEDLVKLELPAAGMESFDVTLSPEGITLHAWDKDDSAIFDAIELLTGEIGIGDEIKRKMQSVIGSPEYFRGTGNGSAVWYWTIRDYDVSYLHQEPGIDNVDIGHAEGTE